MNERIYSLMFRFFPRAFRERFGAELLATARAADRDSRRSRRWTSAMRIALDAFTSALLLHRDMRRETRELDISPEYRDGAFVNSMLRDIQFALRGLSRDLGFTLFVTATLALGIGANAAMFGIADRLLLRGPEHVVESDRVGRFYLTVEPAGMETFTGAWMGHVTYDLLKDNASSFSSVAVFFSNDMVAGRGDAARPVRVGYTSEDLFSLLGVRPVLGRFIEAQDNAEGSAQRVTVIGYGTWQRDFGGEPDVIGRQAVLNDPCTTTSPSVRSAVLVER